MSKLERCPYHKGTNNKKFGVWGEHGVFVIERSSPLERFDCTNLSELLTPPLNFLECSSSDPLHWNLLVASKNQNETKMSKQ